MTEGTVTTGDGCDIAYRFDGPDGAPVLLLSNSLGTNMGMWAPQMAAFSKHFRVLRYDTRGHGRSSAPPGAYSIDRLGRDVVELLDALSIEIANFCGLSLGGMIGQWIGIRERARVSRMVLANTSGFMGPPSAWDDRIAMVKHSGMASLADASVGRWFTPSFLASSPTAVASIRDMLLATNPVGYAGCCAAIRDMDMRRTASLITTPSLIICGIRDPATPQAHSKALADAIPGSTKTTMDCAHLSNIENEKEFAQRVIDFLLK